ncbi:MAG: DNA-directed RNA polymerase subunit omega [Clostridia bacterium]|nr:DNA-directed RNA polymerase subunit omega [Clostridia bacterium]
MLYPSMDKLMESVDSRYSLVIAVAKHARQISEEAEKNHNVLDEKPVKLSINDIADKKVKIIMHKPDEEWEEEKSEPDDAVTDEAAPAEEPEGEDAAGDADESGEE